MYAPRFFYTTCFTILLISLLGMFRYAGAISTTKGEIRQLKEEIRSMHASIDVIEVSAESTPSTVLETRNAVAIEMAVITEIDEEILVVEDEAIEMPTRAGSVTLPRQVHLAVPFTSQAPEKNWDHPWQDACEEAAILMLDAYYKKYNLSPLFARDELLKLVSWQTAQGWGGSIDIVDVRSTAAWYLSEPESHFTIIRYPELVEIKTALANGNPVLAVADGTVLPNPNFRGGGPAYHAFLIIGYDDTTGEFITNDPGTQFGKDFRYTYDDLLNSLRDWNNGDVPNGVPVVLVRN